MFELAVIFGVVVAIMRRADLTALAELRFRGLWFCFLAFAIKLVLFSLGAHGSRFILNNGVWLQLAVTVLLLGLVAANLHLPGMPVVLAGLLANLLVIGLNGWRMPVTASALAATEQGSLVAMLQAHADPGHALVNPHTRLVWLADWIPLNPLHHKVVSPGDIVAALGLAITVGMVVPSRQQRADLARRAPVR